MLLFVKLLHAEEASLFTAPSFFLALWLKRTREDVEVIRLAEGWDCLEAKGNSIEEEPRNASSLPVILATVNADVPLKRLPHMKLVQASQVRKLIWSSYSL